MLPSETVREIADEWVREFSVDPYVLREREMVAWIRLDGLIYNDPLDALHVFERLAEKTLLNCTFEGVAAGPLRSFLMLYGNRYDDELAALKRRSSTFATMHVLAIEGF